MKRCGDCAQYLPPNGGCEIKLGHFGDDDSCELWESKKAMCGICLAKSTKKKSGEVCSKNKRHVKNSEGDWVEK